MDIRADESIGDGLQTSPAPVAIVGIGCRFPRDADRPEKFWRMLREKVCAIREFPSDRFNSDLIYNPDPDVPQRSITKWAGFVEGITQFDAEFFGVSPREAEAMDPQQRVMLHVTWEALEDAGIAPDALAGSNTGVFVGVCMDDYKTFQRILPPDIDVSHFPTGFALSIVSNRVSHKLDFRGPSVSFDTACSSSLVAVEAACRNLWSGQCDAAVAAGVNVLLDPFPFVMFSGAHMLSSTGQVLTFDERANGFVRAEGAGAVLLKRLDDALTDGDRIYAVIRSAAVNSDGWTSTMTVPNMQAQADMLRVVCRQAGVSPADIDYVEAHGTGTPVGDPIEAHAIGTVFGQDRADLSRPVVGSVKSNVGHLEAAAGVAGLIKAALSLHNEEMVGNPNFERINPNIPLDTLKIEISTDNRPWRRRDRARRAVVNSFGFGGTNACVLLEEAPQPGPKTSRRGTAGDGPWIVPLSAATTTALATMARELADHLATSKRSWPRMRDVAATLALNRAHLPQRLALIARSRDELARQLRAFAEGDDEAYRRQAPPRLFVGRRAESTGIAFAFSGQGSQWFGMGRRLLENDPVFQAAIDDVDRLIGTRAGWSVAEELTRSRDESRIDQTIYTQSCIFAVQVGLFRRWRAWGVEPDVVFGHSLGEIAAAYAAGALSLHDAITVVHYRSVLQSETEGLGAIVAVGLSAEAMQERLIAAGEEAVEIAAINSDQMVTIAGDLAAMNRFLKELTRAVDNDLFVRRVRMNFAPHSPQMDPIKDRFLEGLSALEPRPTRVPLISTVTGREIAGEALDADYWWRNIRRPVLFQNAIQTATEVGVNLYLEIGPDAPLSSLIATCCAEMGVPATVIRSQKKRQNDLLCLNAALAELFVSGGSLSWRAVVGREHHRLDLPRYPFELKEFWIDRDAAEQELRRPTPHPLLGHRLDAAQPTWQNNLTFAAYKYLNDHVVNGSCIFPAAGYFEMMLAVSRELFGDGPIELAEIELTKANFLNPEVTEVFQTRYDPARRRIIIESRPGLHDAAWELRAYATLLTAGPAPEAPMPAPPDGDYRFLRGKELYKKAVEKGYQYGPTFRNIQSMKITRDELWVNLKDKNNITKIPGYIAHPAIIDSVLQSGIGHLVDDSSGTDEAAGIMFLPRGATRLRLERAPTARMLAHLRGKSVSLAQSESDTLVVDAKGRLVLKLDGYRAMAIRKVGESGSAPGAVPQYYVDDLVPSDSPNQSEGESNGLWLIFADRRGIAEKATGSLARAGNRCVLVDHGAAYGGIESNRARVNPHRREDFVQLAKDIADLDLPLAGILFLWPCDEAYARGRQSAERLIKAQSSSTTPALYLVQALAETSSYSGRLFFVTCGARMMSGDGPTPSVLGLGAAPMVGFARTAHSEIQLLQSASIDLDPSDDPAAQARTLLAEARPAANPRETEVAYRRGQRYVARFAARAQGDLAAKTVPAVSPRGTVGYQLTLPSPGDLEQLSVVDGEHAPPREGEVSIGVRAVGLNFRDVMAATGLLPPDAEELPAWQHLGLECAGVVESVGEGVTRLKVGDPVIATAKGCFKSQLVVLEIAAWRRPEGIDHVEAATILSAFSTAYYALLTMGRLHQGETVLIHLGTGGVGLAAIQIARMIGAEILATAGSPEKRDYLRALGIEHVMDSRSLDFADQTLQATNGRGVDVVLNALPGEAIERGISILAPCGRFLEIGKRDIYADSPIGLKVLRQNISFIAIDMARMSEDNPEGLAHVFKEIGDLFAQGRLRPLPAETFPLNEAGAAFERMAKGRHIGKVVVTMDPQDVQVALSDADPPRLDSKGAYVLTGGLGGFGLEVAVWLAGLGARHLYLMSRSGDASDAARAGMQRLKAAGAEPIVVAGDVARSADVAMVFRRIAEDGRSVRGVIHAAVVYDDALIHQLDESRMNNVLAPKMQGAWNLHKATEKLDLDFFVLFSTASVALGNVGQANYVAANSFLDALARFRQTRGLPALSLGWGVLGGAGLVQRSRELRKFFDTAGTPPMPLDISLPALGVLLRKSDPVIAFAAIDWSKYALVSSHVCQQPRIVIRSDGSANESDRRAFHEVVAAPKSTRSAIIARHLIESIARVLKLDAERIEPDIPLQDLGLDSLTGLQLKNRAEAEFQTSLPVATFLESPTVNKLVAVLAKAMDTIGISDSAESRTRTSGRVLSLKQQEVLAALDEHQDRLDYIRSFEYANALRFSPRLDLKLLRDGLARVVEDNPVLATIFPLREGRHVLGKAAIEDMVASQDCSAMSEEEFATFLHDTVMRPMDPREGPLYQYRVFHRPDDTDVFLARSHGLVVDGRSIALTMELPMLLIGGGREQQEAIRGAQSYADFADWQRAFLASPKGRTELLYWKRKLNNPGAPLALPYDYERTGTVPAGAGALTFTLDRETTAHLRRIARSEQCSLFSVLMSVYALLLLPYARTPDLFIGTTASGRTRSELENTLGPLSNSVVVRAPASPASTGLSLLAAIDADVKESLSHQDYPAAEVKRELGLGEPQALALNQVSFSVLLGKAPSELGITKLFANLTGVKLQAGRARAETVVLPPRGVRRDLALLLIIESEGRTVLRLDYDAARFSPRTIKALAQRFKQIARALADEPDTRCELLSGALPLRELVQEEA